MSDFHPVTEMRWLERDAMRKLHNLPVNKATQQALRKAARKLVQEARRRAPVYKGDDNRSPSGALRGSVHQSRRIRREGIGTYSVSVGPISRGRVQLYRGTVEARTGFMRGSYAAAAPVMEAEFVAQFARLTGQGEA
jgi:hypothetical protein